MADFHIMAWLNIVRYIKSVFCSRHSLFLEKVRMTFLSDDRNFFPLQSVIVFHLNNHSLPGLKYLYH